MHERKPMDMRYPQEVEESKNGGVLDQRYTSSDTE